MMNLVRKTFKRGTKLVRNVGKAARRTVKYGTNTVGLTRRGRKSRKSRKSRRNRNRKQQ